MLWNKLLWGATLTGGALYLAVALLCRLRAISPRWRCRALGMCLLFFALPLGVPIRGLLAAVAAPSPQPQGDAFGAAIAPPLDIPLLAGESGPLWWQSLVEAVVPLLPWIWLAGVFLALLVHGGQWHRFSRLLRNTAEPVERGEAREIFNRLCQEMQLPSTPRLMRSPLVAGPMVAGLRPTLLVLPCGSGNAEELELVLRHELTHCKCRDLWLKWAAVLVRSLHWFNPCAHLLARRLDRELELACDADVVLEMSGRQRRLYGAAILQTMARSQGAQLGVYASLCHNKKGMKERLTMMLEAKAPTKALRGISAAALALLCVGGLAVGAATAPELQLGEDNGEGFAIRFNAGQESSILTGLGEDEDKPLDNEKSIFTADAEKEPDGTGTSTPGVGEEVADNCVELTGFIWPTQGGYAIAGLNDDERLSGYPGHTGIDIPRPAGTPVYAAQDAVVVQVEQDETGYGNYLVLDHGGGWQTLYAHCGDLYVETGHTVNAGDVIASVGRTGASTGNQLHFEIRYDGRIHNPLDYFPQEMWKQAR